MYTRSADVSRLRSKASDANIVIVGGGGAAAEAALHSAESWPEARITIVSTSPTLWTRGNSPYEWELSANPRLWATLAAEQRRTYLERFSMGAIAPLVMERLSQLANLSYETGDVTTISPMSDRVRVTIRVPWKTKTIDADVVFQCLGYDGTAVFELLSARAKAALPTGGVTDLPKHLDAGLGVKLAGVSNRLIWPGGAAERYGPGLTDLTLLGEMSRRTLNHLQI